MGHTNFGCIKTQSSAAKEDALTLAIRTSDVPKLDEANQAADKIVATIPPLTSAAWVKMGMVSTMTPWASTAYMRQNIAVCEYYGRSEGFPERDI